VAWERRAVVFGKATAEAESVNQRKSDKNRCRPLVALDLSGCQAMKASICVILASSSLMVGCAASQQPVVAERHYAPAAAATLAFDPPSGKARLAPNLWRDEREAAAFNGFQTESAEFYDVQTDDDQQYYNYPSTYERRVLSDRVGVIYR
jgi:hypothetical protein